MFRLIAALSVLCIVSGNSVPSDDRIVNGRTASINEVPYQVSVQQYNTHFCGGSIINSEWILTAAHCLVDIINKHQINSLSIRAGSSMWNSGGTAKPAAAAINHPSYDAKSMKYDVGLIKLQGKLVYSAVIKPVKFPTSLPPPSTMVLVSGWGKLHENLNELPKIMQAVELSYVPLRECQSLKYGYRSSVMESMICAVGPSKDSCQGDSGGPLTILNTLTQIGVVSWGAGCAQPGMPGVYTDLTDPNVRSFLQTYVGRLQ